MKKILENNFYAIEGLKNKPITCEDVINASHIMPNIRAFYFEAYKNGEPHIVLSYITQEHIIGRKVFGDIVIMDSPSADITNVLGHKVHYPRISVGEHSEVSFEAKLPTKPKMLLTNIKIRNIREADSSEIDKCLSAYANFYTNLVEVKDE